MKRNFGTALTWVLASEGGYANNPNDPGGETNKGITHITYDAWRKSHGEKLRNVREITDSEVAQIYRHQYWGLVRGDDLPDGLDYAMFDFAVNSGPGRAVKTLQKIIGANGDGVMGVHTLAALRGYLDGYDTLIVELCRARLKYLRGLRGWKHFGRGWTRRIAGNVAGVQADDIGVMDRSVRLARNQVKDIPAPVPTAKPAGKGVGPEKMSVTLAGMAGNGPALGAAASALGSVAAMGSGSGPVQYALAGVLVLAALAALVVLVRRKS